MNSKQNFAVFNMKQHMYPEPPSRGCFLKERIDVTASTILGVDSKTEDIMKAYFGHIYTKQSIHNQFKPLLNLFRILGLCPVAVSQYGTLKFSFCSVIMLYTIAMQCIDVVLVYLNLPDRTSQLMARNVSFDETVFNLLLLLGLIGAASSPVLMWMDLPDIVKSADRWMAFQFQFKSVTKRCLRIQIRTRCLLSTVYCVTVGLVAFGLTLVPPYIPIWRIPPYYCSVTMLNCEAINVLLMITAMTQAGTCLTKQFRKDMQDNKDTLTVISDYRILWLHLSKLIQQVANSMGRSFICYLVMLISCLTITLYGSLGGITREVESRLRVFGMYVISIGVIVPFCLVTNNGHKLTENVTSDMEEILYNIPTKGGNKAYLEEVNFFIQTIKNNPPVLSMLGYLTINRKLFKGVTATIVAYLFILLQFDAGVSQHSSENNATLHTF